MRIAAILAAAVLAGCGAHEAAPGAGEAPHAHPERFERSGYGPATEVFAEFAPPAVGSADTPAIHVTRLADWRPLTAGSVTVILQGGGAPEERYAAEAPASAGIFKPVVRPASAGERSLRIRVRAEGIDETHDLGTLPVAAAAAGPAAHPETPAEEGVVFTKEQQWKVEFATAAAATRSLRASVPATARVRASANGEAFLHAPVDGHLVTQGGGFPAVGMRVAKGQVLARLLPHLGRGNDFATLELDLAKSRLALQRARRERERMERLHAEEAVAERRVTEARGDELLAQAEVEAATRRLAHFRAAPATHGEEGLPLAAPIAGVVVAAEAAPGAFLAEGARIAHIADLDRLWLEARVPESEIARLKAPTGLSVRLPGLAESIDFGEGEARLLAIGGAVDPESRSVPVVFELARPHPLLKLGMALEAQIHTGSTAAVLAAPASALVDEAGVTTVYVQRGGERFERRIVRTGLRDGEWVEIREGLRPGERLVARGAYLVKLAALRSDAVSHSHAH